MIGEKDNENLFAALKRLVPSHLLPFSILNNTDKPFWGLVFKGNDGIVREFDLKALEEEIGPQTIHMVSNRNNLFGPKKTIGSFGVQSWGTFDNEPAHLNMLYEESGGGTGAIHFAIHPRLGLLVGQILETRNRKMRLSGGAAPRGYDGKIVTSIQGRIDAARQTALEESAEEAAVFENMETFTITWADGHPFTTDQNGSTQCAGRGEGFKYQGTKWPMNLLRKVVGHEFVWEADPTNPLVKPGKSEKEMGHTGQLFFIRYDDLWDRSVLPGWDLDCAADGLGMTGIPALYAQLKHEGKLKV